MEYAQVFGGGIVYYGVIAIVAYGIMRLLGADNIIKAVMYIGLPIAAVLSIISVINDPSSIMPENPNQMIAFFVIITIVSVAGFASRGKSSNS